MSILLPWEPKRVVSLHRNGADRDGILTATTTVGHVDRGSKLTLSSNLGCKGPELTPQSRCREIGTEGCMAMHVNAKRQKPCIARKYQQRS